MSAAGLTDGRPSAGFKRVFGWYARRLVRKRFAAIRAMPGAMDVLCAIGSHDGPAIVAMNHSSWWDPMIPCVLHPMTAGERGVFAPIDEAMLRKFRFFARCGLFGVEPDSPASLSRLADYSAREFAREPRSTLWITPQGRFADVRSPIVLRPGVGVVAHRARGPKVAVLAVEYGFWTEQRPEVFLSARIVDAPSEASARGWHRAIEASLSSACHDLADAVMTRDPARFEMVFGGAGATINPVYDAMLRARGQGAAIDVRARRAGVR
ncbi:MAG: acyltransferase [Planctomycetes bacterium]|nr:acyltransferase [Planctomycetota bacterium]